MIVLDSGHGITCKCGETFKTNEEHTRHVTIREVLEEVKRTGGEKFYRQAKAWEEDAHSGDLQEFTANHGLELKPENATKIAKNELVDQGVVIERNVNSQNEKRKLLQLTEKGRDYAEDELDLDTKHQGRGGIIHRYWQHRIKEAFEEQGWDAHLEKFDADVYANTEEKEIVVEVAMGDNQREIDHVKQHLETGFDKVCVAARNQEVLEGLKQRIDEARLDTDQVAFRLVRKFRAPEAKTR